MRLLRETEMRNACVLALVLWAFLMMLESDCHGQTTLIMNASKQTVIRPSDPNGTYGGLDEMPFDAGDQLLIQYWAPFILIPEDAHVVSVHAVLYLHDYVDAPRPRAARMLLIWDSAVTWSETGSGGGGWNTEPGIQFGEASMGLGAIQGLTYDIETNTTPPPVAQMWLDITPIFDDWADGQPNRGIVIYLTNGDTVVYGPNTQYRSEMWVSYAFPGDADFDGAFNQRDIIQVLQAGKYATGQVATWQEGDWNGDHVFDAFDIVLALQQTGDNAYDTGSEVGVIAAFGEDWLGEEGGRPRPPRTW